jgi:plasmid maintenance system antidote protein VapI
MASDGAAASADADMAGEMVVNPWEATGNMNYDKLIEQFGSQAISPALIDRFERVTGRRAHTWIRVRQTELARQRRRMPRRRFCPVRLTRCPAPRLARSEASSSRTATWTRSSICTRSGSPCTCTPAAARRPRHSTWVT